MNGWQTFFAAETTASAALTGLIFIGVSINLNKILSLDRLPDRALQALSLLMAVLILSSLLLVPGQSLLLIGCEILLVGAIIWTLLVVFDVRNFRRTEPKYRRVFTENIILSQFAGAPYLIAGLSVLLGGADGLYWLVPAILFSFLKALVDAWVLLIEIHR